MTEPALTPYRTLVFDWDGTLADSIGPIVDCTVHAFAELDLTADLAAVRGSIGIGLRESLAAFFPEATAELHERAYGVYRDLWRGTYRDRVTLFPGVPELLERLAAAGHCLTVATAKSRYGLDRDLVETGLGRLFAATRTIDEAPSKPNPQMLFDLLELTGSRAAETLMVGDTAHDLLMARHAGIAAVAVLSGAHPHETLAPATPRAILAGVWELEAYLESTARPELLS